MGTRPTQRQRKYADPQSPIPDAPLGSPTSANPAAAASSPGSPGHRGPPQEPSPQPPGSPGHRGPPQEPSPQSPGSAAPTFAASPGPPGRRRSPQEPSPQPWISAPPAPAAAAASQGPTISTTPAATDAAASVAPPGRRGPPQEPRHQPMISATSAFDAVVSQDPPACHRPPQEPSPQPPKSATPAVAAASPGPLGLRPPQNPIPQTPSVASDPLIVEIEDWKGCRALLTPESAKIVATISEKFPIRDLPLLEATIAKELKKPQELRSFVVANPEIISELRKRKAIDAREWVLRRVGFFAFPGPPGRHRPPHEPSPQPPISAVPAAAAAFPGPPGPRGPHQEPKPRPRISATPAFAASLDPAARHQPPQEPSTQPPIFATPAVAVASSSSGPLGPRPPVLINNLGDLVPASPGSAKIIAIISGQFPPCDLPLLEERIATELKKPQELQSFVVANPEIISVLRKQWKLLRTSAWVLNSKIEQIIMLHREMDEIKREILSFGIRVEGITDQMTLLYNAGRDVFEDRLNLRLQHRI